MSISGLSSASLSVYLQYLTGSSSQSDSTSSITALVYGASSGSSSTGTSSTTTSSVRTTYFDEAAQGTVLTAAGQTAAQAELKAVIANQLFDLSA